MQGYSPYRRRCSRRVTFPRIYDTGSSFHAPNGPVSLGLPFSLPQTVPSVGLQGRRGHFFFRRSHSYPSQTRIEFWPASPFGIAPSHLLGAAEAVPVHNANDFRFVRSICEPGVDQPADPCEATKCARRSEHGWPDRCGLGILPARLAPAHAGPLWLYGITSSSAGRLGSIMTRRVAPSAGHTTRERPDQRSRDRAG